MKISRLFNSLPKRIAAVGIVALASALPFAASAASMVNISATTNVANASTNGSWSSSANASYNQVVDIEVVYDNNQPAGSGQVASNLRVKINIPTAAGATQTVTTTTSADNSNTVHGTATVNLSNAAGYLQYIPGTATWKHAVSANSNQTVTQNVSDDVVLNANGLVLENENPCQAGSIQVQARVMVPGVSINKQVRIKGTSAWSTSITANPGQTVQYLISYANTGNAVENSVVIGDKLPNGVTYVPGTSFVANDSAPNGTAVADGVTTSGIAIGTYNPGANAFVIFNATLPSADQLACGSNLLRNIATAQPQGMNYYWNTADVTISKTCTQPSQPTYSCDLFTAAPGDNRTVTVNGFKDTATNGATFNNVVIAWGDQTTPLTTNNPVGQTHQYSAYGSYTLTATAHFTVNGKDVTATNSCTQTVSFTAPNTPTTPTTPITPTSTTLPNTGAGNVIGLFLGATIVSTVGYRLFLARRLARQ